MLDGEKKIARERREADEKKKNILCDCFKSVFDCKKHNRYR